VTREGHKSCNGELLKCPVYLADETQIQRFAAGRNKWHYNRRKYNPAYSIIIFTSVKLMKFLVENKNCAYGTAHLG
jgi:hypothetical protein